MFTLRIEKVLQPTFWERLQRPHSSFGGTIVKEESKINQELLSLASLLRNREGVSRISYSSE